ncbi:hypothetical protein NU09_1097 [Flavobacterium beibuense]|uniref:Uncharacterized protein n=2 Tax=Flavobacterium beibuense TaxID=657326 RepID=A0A444WF84_9FLAO|nr:hypothetical protein NU09_1097 [Flavobacterium beibuense]
MSTDYYGVYEQVANEINSFRNASNDIDIIEIKSINGCFDTTTEYKRIWLANNKLNGIHNGKEMFFTADDAARFETIFENISTDHIYISNPFNRSTLHIRDTYYIKVKGEDTYTFSLDSNLKQTATAGREELFKYALYINNLNADSF